MATWIPQYQKRELSGDSSTLERELGLKAGMHGKKVSRGPFAESLLRQLSDRYVIFRSYNSNANPHLTFDPQVVLCGYTHPEDKELKKAELQELKKVVGRVAEQKDVILLEGESRIVRDPKDYPMPDDPFRDFVGKVAKVEFNDNPALLKLQAGQEEGSRSEAVLARKRNIQQFSPSIMENVREHPEGRIFQRIGLRHVMEWMDILHHLEHNEVSYTSIIPRTVSHYTDEQRNFYNRLARTNAKSLLIRQNL